MQVHAFVPHRSIGAAVFRVHHVSHVSKPTPAV
jgi:hypothetical protein